MATITIRNVPDEVRDELAARAARSGRSLQAYLRAELIERARKPTVAEVLARAQARARASGTNVSAERILGFRDDDRK